MSHLFEYSQIKPELILQTFLHSPLHFLGLSASSQCGYYERSRNPSYCKPANSYSLRHPGSAQQRSHTHPPTWRRETDQQVLHLSLHTCTHEMPPPVPHLLRLAAGDIIEANNPAFGQVQVP